MSVSAQHCFYETVQEEIPLISVPEFTVAIISTNQGDFFPLSEGTLTCLRGLIAQYVLYARARILKSD